MDAKDSDRPASGSSARKVVWRLIRGTLIVLSVCVTLLAAVLGYFVYSVDSDLMTKAEIRALAARCPHDREVCLTYTDVAALPDHVVDAFVAAMRPTPFKRCWICVLLRPLMPDTLMATAVARHLMQFRETRVRAFGGHANLALMQLKTEYTLSPEFVASIFLSNAYFGKKELHGLEAASVALLVKPPGELTVAEAAELAAVLRSPSHLLKNTDKRLHWRNRILDQMVTDGTLAQETAAALKEAPSAVTE